MSKSCWSNKLPQGWWTQFRIFSENILSVVLEIYISVNNSKISPTQAGWVGSAFLSTPLRQAGWGQLRVDPSGRQDGVGLVLTTQAGRVGSASC